MGVEHRARSSSWTAASGGGRDSLRRDKTALFGGFVVLAFVLLAIFAPFLAPHDPTQQFTNGLSAARRPAARRRHSFPLGTDDLGRDLLSRLIYGARISLIIGILANGLAIAHRRDRSARSPPTLAALSTSS